MTTNTPPGWYAEPGHTGNGPAMERWWDGGAWTQYTRTAPVQDAAQAYPYAYPSGDIIATPGGGGGRRTGTVTIAIVAALVLIGAVVAGALVLGKNSGGDKNDAKNTPTPTPTATQPPRRQLPPPSPSSPGGGPGDGGDQGTPTTGGPAVDAYDGISLPVLDGWQGSSGSNGIGASVVTGGYPCPKDASQDCVRGGAFAEPAAALKITTSSPEAAAKADIAPNAANAYGASTYGATTSHQEVASEPVTVAGQKGYLVRWKIATKSGTGGYVESLVFPSPTDSTKLVVVRFGFDIGDQAPGPGDMDRITQGIKADSSGGPSGTGV